MSSPSLRSRSRPSTKRCSAWRRSISSRASRRAAMGVSSFIRCTRCVASSTGVRHGHALPQPESANLPPLLGALHDPSVTVGGEMQSSRSTVTRSPMRPPFGDKDGPMRGAMLVATIAALALAGLGPGAKARAAAVQHRRHCRRAICGGTRQRPAALPHHPAKLAAAVADLNRQKLAFVVHLGDFIDRDWASYDLLLPIARKLTPSMAVRAGQSRILDRRCAQAAWFRPSSA